MSDRPSHRDLRPAGDIGRSLTHDLGASGPAGDIGLDLGRARAAGLVTRTSVGLPSRAGPQRNWTGVHHAGRSRSELEQGFETGAVAPSGVSGLSLSRSFIVRPLAVRSGLLGLARRRSGAWV